MHICREIREFTSYVRTRVGAILKLFSLHFIFAYLRVLNSIFFCFSFLKFLHAPNKPKQNKTKQNKQTNKQNKKNNNSPCFHCIAILLFFRQIYNNSLSVIVRKSTRRKPECLLQTCGRRRALGDDVFCMWFIP